MEELYITDLIDVDVLQQIQDAFSKLTGIASITTDACGVAVTEGTNFSEFCSKYTRGSALGCIRCAQCDRYGGELALEKGSSTTYTCHAGLIDFAAPIMAGDKMVGCFIGGQVLTEPPDITKIMTVAREINIDPINYLQAALKINIVPKESIEKAADFLYTITSVLSNIAYHKYLVYQANKEIEKAAQMKSDFLANMSHEIRTPMNAVIGMAEMALRENLSPEARDYVTQIKSSGKTLLTIINDILDFSKIESGKMDISVGEYELLSIIHDVSNIIMTRIDSKDVELILDITPDIPCKLYGDSIRIKQIILNLANNAVKFTEHGQVVLKIDYFKRSSDEIELVGSLTDTGIGIKKEDVGKLFQSFQQLDSKRNRNIEGTGLGLAISKQLLTLMRGDIWVESEYGKGSCFSFILPQRVSDFNPCITRKESASFFVAGILDNPYVRAQLEADIKRLGGRYMDISSDDELLTLTEQENVFLFMEQSCFSEQIKHFLLAHPKITGVLILDFHANASSSMDNLLLVKKPLYSLNIAAILNHEDFHSDYMYSSQEDFEFVAPEAEILLVDDNAINLTVAEGLLEPLQMKIDKALSGKEALEKIAAKHYDLIFMDHMMPELDGVETTHIIRRFHEDYKDVPIIALTANAVSGTKAMFLREGLDDFVAKPIEVRIIVSKLKQWLPDSKIQKIYEQKSKPQEQEPTEILQIEGLDTETALKLLGSEKLYWAVLKDYYRVIKKKMQLIENYEKKEDLQHYTIEVHALKSASRQIGATELSEKAAALEKAGNDQDLTKIHKYTAEMLELYSDYLRILQPYFPDELPKDSSKEEVSTDSLITAFANLREALDNLDMALMEEVIRQMNQYRYVDWQAEMFSQLQSAIEEVDVDTCESILQVWEDGMKLHT